MSKDANAYLPTGYKTNIPILARQFKEIFRDETVLICPLMHGGKKDFEIYERFMGKVDCDFPDYVTVPIEATSDMDKHGEYRLFNTPVDVIQGELAGIRANGSTVRNMVVFDNVLRTGGTMVGGELYGLLHRKDLDIETVWGMASYDLLGIVPFSIFKAFDRWIGFVNFLKNGAPEHNIPPLKNTYRMLVSEGLLDSIGDGIPGGINGSQKDLKLRNISDAQASEILTEAFKKYIRKKE